MRNDRATPAEIASYYQHYVSKMSLEQNFACGTTVTSVTRQAGTQDGAPPCWRIRGLQRREEDALGGRSPSDVGNGGVESTPERHFLSARWVLQAGGSGFLSAGPQRGASHGDP